MGEARIRFIAWASLAIGALLLVWPTSPDVALWDLPGMFGGGSTETTELLWSDRAPSGGDGRVVTPLTSLLTGEALADRGDRVQLALGLVLIGIAAGAALTLPRTRKPARKRPTIHSGYQA
jgi:hypothetical protein